MNTGTATIRVRGRVAAVCAVVPRMPHAVLVTRHASTAILVLAVTVTPVTATFAIVATATAAVAVVIVAASIAAMRVR
jgi:hypothetical protein